MIKMTHEEQKRTLTEEGKDRGLSSTEMKVLSRDPFFVGTEKDVIE